MWGGVHMCLPVGRSCSSGVTPWPAAGCSSFAPEWSFSRPTHSLSQAVRPPRSRFQSGTSLAVSAPSLESFHPHSLSPSTQSAFFLFYVIPQGSTFPFCKDQASLTSRPFLDGRENICIFSWEGLLTLEWDASFLYSRENEERGKL